MPKETFFGIDNEKQNRVIQAAIKVFSSHNYNDSSISILGMSDSCFICKNVSVITMINGVIKILINISKSLQLFIFNFSLSIILYITSKSCFTFQPCLLLSLDLTSFCLKSFIKLACNRW